MAAVIRADPWCPRLGATTIRTIAATASRQSTSISVMPRTSPEAVRFVRCDAWCMVRWFNTKVSDWRQPPLMVDLSLSESAGSGSLHRLVGRECTPAPTLLHREVR